MLYLAVEHILDAESQHETGPSRLRREHVDRGPDSNIGVSAQHHGGRRKAREVPIGSHTHDGHISEHVESPTQSGICIGPNRVTRSAEQRLAYYESGGWPLIEA